MWIKTFEEYRKSDWIDAQGKEIKYSGRGDKITLEQAVALYNQHCSDWDLEQNKVIYRGAWIDSNYSQPGPLVSGLFHKNECDQARKYPGQLRLIFVLYDHIPLRTPLVRLTDQEQPHQHQRW